MFEKRNDLVFDFSKGVVYIEDPLGKSDINILKHSLSEIDCRFALSMYDLGAAHKSQEVRKVLGIK